MIVFTTNSQHSCTYAISCTSQFCKQVVVAQEKKWISYGRSHIPWYKRQLLACLTPNSKTYFLNVPHLLKYLLRHKVHDDFLLTQHGVACRHRCLFKEGITKKRATWGRNYTMAVELVAFHINNNIAEFLSSPQTYKVAPILNAVFVTNWIAVPPSLARTNPVLHLPPVDIV